MVIQELVLRCVGFRGLLIIAALVSLCVSNNVGPSFLPLPVVTDRVAERTQETQQDKSSRAPSPAGSDSFRVPMMGQAQKRADKEYHAQPIAASSTVGILLPD